MEEGRDGLARLRDLVVVVVDVQRSLFLPCMFRIIFIFKFTLQARNVNYALNYIFETYK